MALLSSPTGATESLNPPTPFALLDIMTHHTVNANRGNSFCPETAAIFTDAQRRGLIEIRMLLLPRGEPCFHVYAGGAAGAAASVRRMHSGTVVPTRNYCSYLNKYKWKDNIFELI